MLIDSVKNPSIFPRLLSFTVVTTILPITNKLGSIDRNFETMSRLFTLYPISSIYVTSCMGLKAFAIHFRIAPLASINRTIFKFSNAKTFKFAFAVHISFVNRSIFKFSNLSRSKGWQSETELFLSDFVSHLFKGLQSKFVEFGLIVFFKNFRMFLAEVLQYILNLVVLLDHLLVRSACCYIGFSKCSVKSIYDETLGSSCFHRYLEFQFRLDLKFGLNLGFIE